jgi:hypothetical protein
VAKNSNKVKETEQEKALAKVSKSQFARYEQVFAPFEDKWLKESRVSQGEKDLLAGHIAGNVSQAVADRQRQLTGVNPASGNFNAAMRGLAVGKGKALGRGLTEGNMQAENADVTALMSGIRLGRGQAIEAQAGMEDLAGMATSKAIGKAFNAQAERDATAGMVGSAMGAAAYGVGKFGALSSGSDGIDVADLKRGYSVASGTATPKPTGVRYGLGTQSLKLDNF